ncbi:phage integrase family site specific recombinase [Campylobacter hyointestinalis subsp. hyointestinalis]|uniref:Phage integrase family site specific recombinase n=1 Tax=Campylobacter hyointestinalis subsp. hyointestinalis TaxID=91352 RepID=A0A0S4SVZ9_CAMHY|nr:site-specific integrase [Campylobacter hyointestinalis]CUU89885.1 phage integrase family site specific recombinase [Campylobacter hyointestinalis subsp. hyointestinalis]
MQLEKSGLIDDLERWNKMFLEDLKAKNYSNNTIKLYERATFNFIEYMREFDEEMTMKTIKSFTISGYLHYLDSISRNDKLTISSKESYLKGIFGLFTFISDNNDEFFTYERILSKSRLKQKQHKEDKIDFFTDLENARINAWLKDKNIKLTRNLCNARLLIKFMLFSGLRVSEVLNLKFSDLKYQNDDIVTINIIGKGDYQQKAIISFSLIELEINFLEENANSQDDYIFLTYSGKKIARESVYLKLNAIYRKLGIRELGCHVLRHTLAMNLVKKGVNITTIKDILRHSSLNETQRYAKAEYSEVGKTIIENAKSIKAEND